MKKILTIMLALVFVLSAAGCGASKEGPSESTAPQTSAATDATKAPETPASFVSAEPITVTYMVQEHPSWPFNKDWAVYKNISEATNVKFEFMPATGDAYTQKLRMLFATDDLPDMIDYNLATANEFGVAGQLAKVNEYLDSMPNYKKILDANPESYSMLTSGDGNMYYMPCYGLPEYTKIWLYRSDIFEKNSLKAPTNTDELYNVLKQLKTLYPDSTPLTSRNGVAWLGDLAYQWGTGQMVYFNTKTNKWQFGPAEDNFKAMLQYLNKLSSEKLLDPEWSTLATKQWEDKMYEDNKTFVAFDYVYRIETMLPAATQKNAGWKIKALEPINQEGVGEKKYAIRSRLSQTDGLMISSNSKYQKELFKLADYLYSDEGAILSNFGKVGETAIKNSDGTYNWASNIKTAMNPSGTDDYNTKYGFLTLGSYLRATEDSNKILYLSNKDVQAAFDLFDANNYAAPLQPILKFTDEERKQVAELETSIKDYVQAEQVKFVQNGGFDKWDAFVAKIKDMKADQLVEIYNNMQARQK
ncbi:MAG: extracellular solute-binding protein [Clostridiaceae bacterium]